MSVATATAKPTKQRDPYGVKIPQTNTNQAVIQIPYLAGLAKLPVMWCGGPYGLRVVDITQQQGSGKGSTTSTVGHKYYANLIGIICIGPADRIIEIVINNSIIWTGNILRASSPDFAQIGLPGDDGQIRIYWGTSGDPAPSWFGTGSDFHPGYRWRCRIELYQLLYGASDTTQVPNVEVVLERYPSCTQFDQIMGGGNHALYIPEVGVSPFGCLYEWMFHPVYGAGMVDVTDFTNWKNAIADTFNNYLLFCPKVDASETFKSLIQKLFEYFDGWMRMTPSGLIQVGRFAHQLAIPVVTLTDHQFLAEPKITTKMLDDTLNQAIVKFVNQQYYFKDDSVSYNDFGNQLVTGYVKSVQYDRPWITNPSSAYTLVVLMGMLYANPIISGTIVVSKEFVSGVNPGDLIQIDSDTYNMAGLFRVKARTLSEATKWTCELELEQERGTYPSLYSDTVAVYPTKPQIESLDITTASIVELPAGLGKSIYGPTITILAQRDDPLMQGFIPWFTKDPIGRQVYDDTNIQCRFAVGAKLLSDIWVTDTVDTTYGFWIHALNFDGSLLTSQPDLARDNFEWLIFAGNEIMSLGRVAAYGNNRYNVFTRRACFGTAMLAHYTNEILWFVQRANMPVVTHSTWKNGETWYFKLQGFNQTHIYDLSLSSIFTYKFHGDAGSSGLAGPTNFIVGTSGNAVLFNWKNDVSIGAVGYEIRYGAVSGVWSNAKVAATKIHSSQSIQLTNIPPNVWKFYLASMDVYGAYSTPVTYILTIPAFTYILTEKNYGRVQHALDPGIMSTPDWDKGNGTIFTGCLVHPTAYGLLPQDTQTASYVPAGGTGFELFDNFVNGWPDTCTVEFPVIDSLGSGVSIRNSEIVNEYLIGLLNQGIAGEDFVIALNPSWSKAEIVNGVVHPTVYSVIPTTIHNASYVPSGGTGFELFDQFIFDVQQFTTISYIQDVNEPYPWDATLNAFYKPGYSNSTVVATLSISWSSDLITWHQLVSGTEFLATNYVARYVRFQLVLNNLPPLDVIVSLAPQWSQATLVNGVVHPTAYCVMPTTIHNASYVPGGGTGFELFDQFIFDVQSSTTVSYIKDLIDPFPWSATLNASYAPGYSNGAITATLSISGSNDLITWTSLASGPGSLASNFTSRYIRYQIVLDNTHPVGFVKTMDGEIVSVYALDVHNVGFVNAMGGEITAGTSKYWTSIFAEIKTSPDNITFGNWAEVTSTFVSDEYIKPRITWNPIAGQWPVSVSSMWLLLDANQNSQADFGVAVPSGGVTVTFPIPYRSKVSVTVTSVSGSSAYAEVTSYTLTSFTVQIFNAGSPIAGFINWHAIGV